MITPDFTLAQWRKSSYSGSNGGQCVEVAATSTVVGVRDSKNATGPLLAVSAASWQWFLTAVR